MQLINCGRPKLKRGQPPKAVIAVPIEPVARAGAKSLSFKSEKEAAEYFGMKPQCLNRILIEGDAVRPSCGYYFDYEIESND